MADLSERLRAGTRELTRSYVLFIAIGVVVGLQLAPFAASFAASQAGPAGTVAVVPLEGGINGATAAGVTAMLTEARQDPSIEAVVLLTNSPGGGASSSETLYLQVSQTAAEMPVVGSVDSFATSGAYYALAPADVIYAKPASFVGSVGTFTTLPQELEPIDQVIASGPSKLRGGDTRDWYYKTEAVQNSFLNAVVEGRGDRLEMSRAEVSYAQFYPGSVAVQKGLVDDIGGLSAAVKEAARRADLDSYRVEVLRPDTTPTFISRANYVASNATEKRLVSPAYFVGGPNETVAVPTVVMLPGSVLAAAKDMGPVVRANGTEVSADGGLAG